MNAKRESEIKRAALKTATFVVIKIVAYVAVALTMLALGFSLPGQVFVGLIAASPIVFIGWMIYEEEHHTMYMEELRKPKDSEDV